MALHFYFGCSFSVVGSDIQRYKCLKKWFITNSVCWFSCHAVGLYLRLIHQRKTRIQRPTCIRKNDPACPPHLLPVMNVTEGMEKRAGPLVMFLLVSHLKGGIVQMRQIINRLILSSHLFKHLDWSALPVHAANLYNFSICSFPKLCWRKLSLTQTSTAPNARRQRHSGTRSIWKSSSRS